MNEEKSYLTFKEYCTLNLMPMSIEEFNGSLSRATIKFDLLTDYEFGDRGIDEEPRRVKNRLKLAIGVLVEDVYVTAKMNSLAGELKTFTMGGSSQTRFSPNEVGVSSTGDYPSEVLDLLRSLGLLKRVKIRSVAIR